jgi:hypothetical protein
LNCTTVVAAIARAARHKWDDGEVGQQGPEQKLTSAMQILEMASIEAADA